MIDISNLVFDTVYSQLASVHSDANITAGYDEKLADRLNVVIREAGNVPYVSGNTDDCAENFTRVTFEVEVESSKKDTARSEISSVMADADAIMQSMKFRRIHLSKQFNLDRYAYRQYARYEAIVGKPVVINEGLQNEKTVYQMYRR